MKTTFHALSFTTKMLILILVIFICTIIAFVLLTQHEIEKVMWNTVSASVNDMRKLITLYIESEYQDLIFHKEYALNGYKEQLKNVTKIVIANIDHYYSLYKRGILSEEDAKNFALENIENYRYGNNDYFYIYSTDLVAIAHPDQETKGMDMTNYQDEKGNFPLKMIQKTVLEKGKGFDSFWYFHLDEEKPIEKLTYNYLYKPWEWIIGTGVYIDDINKDIESKLSEILGNIRDTFSKIHIDENGYFFMFDSNHIILVHPTMEGMDFVDIDKPGLGIEHWEHLVEVSKMPDKPYTYYWDKPGHEGVYKYKKVSYVDYFEPLDWFIVSTFYIDELEEPARRIFRWSITIGFLALFISCVLTIFLIKRFTKPVKILTEHAKDLIKNDFIPTDSNKLFDLTERSHDEMGNLAGTFINMESTLQNYITELKQTTSANEKIRTELKIAHDIQMSMLPKKFPAFPNREEIDIYAMLIPAKEVGGDFYDFFFMDDHHLCFMIGDVSDKGVPAALFMAQSKSLIRATSMLLRKKKTDIPSPHHILSEVNNELCINNEHCMFLTLLLGILNLHDGKISITSAGHNPPYVIMDDHIEKNELPHKTPLGVHQNVRYRSEEIELSPRNGLFLYTDGITEATDNKNKLFGEERLEHILQNISDHKPSSILNLIIKEVRNFVGEMPQSDDITMLEIRFLSKMQKE